MIRPQRCDFAIPARRDSRKFQKLTVKVRLVAVPRREGQIGPGCATVRRRNAQGSLETAHPAVDFWCESHRSTEQLDESPVAVAALGDNVANAGFGLEPLE